ncbi:MAG: right-handed parallel beta-helix repeat-containing protein [Phycisphaerales bacterium]
MHRPIHALLFGGAIFSAGIGQAQVTNGSFETGDFTGWSVSDIPNPYEPMSVTSSGTSHAIGNFGAYFGGEIPFSTTSPTAGNYAFWTGFDGDPGAGAVFQDVLINRPSLMFDYRAAWLLSGFGAQQDREFRVVVREAGGGAVLATFPQLTAPAGTNESDTGPQTGVIDLSAFAGQTVQLAFEWDVPESFTGPAGFQLDNVRLEGLSLVPVVFADASDFICGGDRLSPPYGYGTYCDYVYNGNYPDSTVYLRAGRDYCDNRYDGTYIYAGVPDPIVFSRSAGTSGGLVGAEARVEGVISNTFRSGSPTYRTRVDFMVSAYVTVPGFNDPCGYAYGGYGTYQANADANGNLRLFLSEPMRLTDRSEIGGMFPSYSVGDVVPEGYHTLSSPTAFASANAAYGGGTFESRFDQWAEFEFTDCDGNGVNDLREADSDDNGVTDACEPVQNLTRGTGFGTLQAAIDASLDSDVIEVAPGTYSEQIRFSGRPVTLRSAAGPELTTIDSGGPGWVVLFDSGETRSTVFEGFTVTGATDDNLAGLGVFASPTIRDCIVRDNSGEFGGGARVIGAPLFDRVRFYSNIASENGGAVDNDFEAGSEFVNCVFAGNTAGSNGGAVLVFDATATFINCTVADNSAGFGGGIVSWSSTAPTTAIIRNSVVTDNTPGNVSLIGGGTFDAEYNLFPVPVGATNIGGAPKFVDAANLDYSISSGSDAIDAGDSNELPAGFNLDAAGMPRRSDDTGTPDTGPGAAPVVDIGAYEFQGTTPEPCPADLDGNGTLNLDDIDLFVALFLAADLRADLDGNGALNLDDIDAFVVSFLAGCG